MTRSPPPRLPASLRGAVGALVLACAGCVFLEVRAQQEEIEALARVGGRVATEHPSAHPLVVVLARRDGENAAQAVLQFLRTQQPMKRLETVLRRFERRLEETNLQVIKKERLASLEQSEQTEAQRLGLTEFKLSTNEEMFAAMGL